MKEPYWFTYNNINSIDVQKYMSEDGFVAGLATAWKDYVCEMFEHFEADIAANEGIEAVIRDLKPARRKLRASRKDERIYIIECNEGGASVYLTVEDDDSLILSFPGSSGSVEDGCIDLSCYDSAEAAYFISLAFKAYRELNNRFWRALSEF